MSFIYVKLKSTPKPVIAYNIETKQSIVGESISELAFLLGCHKATISNVLNYSKIYQNIWLIDHQNYKNISNNLSISKKYWKSFLSRHSKTNKYIHKNKIKVVYNYLTDEFLYTRSLKEINTFTGINSKKIRYLLKNSIYNYDHFFISYSSNKSQKIPNIMPKL